MKTLSTVILAAMVGGSTPVVVTENLIGISYHDNNVVALSWDTSGNDVEDMKVYYNYVQKYVNGIMTTDPFMYAFDRDGNGKYEEEEFVNLEDEEQARIIE